MHNNLTHKIIKAADDVRAELFFDLKRDIMFVDFWRNKFESDRELVIKVNMVIKKTQ